MKILPIAIATLAALGASTAQAATYSGYTAPGTKLSIGDSAILPMHIPSKGAFPARITVTGIERGSMEDLRRAGFSIPPALANHVPYYVNYSMAIVDMNGYGPSEIAGLAIFNSTAIDDRNEARMATIFTPGSAMAGAHFDRCRRPAVFGSNAGVGSTASGCQIYMVNANGAITGWRIQISAESFNGDNAYWNSPVVWSSGAAPQVSGDKNW